MKGLLILIGSLLLISCAALPVIRPSADQTMTCPSPFLPGKTRLIHTIEARLSGETKAAMIGVTLADPILRTISCALMSAEGMVLFEASSGPEGLQISRALPPFDAADFAQNMMDDIELIFLAPSGALQQKGVLTEGYPVCRRHKEPGGWIDVLSDHDGRIQIRRYSEGGRLQRRVTLAGGTANPYSSIELHASERVDYTLVMMLIESEMVKDDASPLRENIKGPHP